ncbi:SIR2 family protein [Heyndrickxia sp. FSL W8-0496]|uniref:SIR2 family protein n=1 Tax=Heyndrickxia oleronia TaxID=38875 RepID=A0AAW6SX10_9BACI|nr:SIR2 family protein [Heyndrickxia oleronia]MDH5163405.1 SIR2 family protein [Heyndrickxia oleronia]
MSIQRLIEKIRNNDVVLWAGSGLSFYAGMPKVSEIINEILEKCTEEEKNYIQGKTNLAEVANDFIAMRSGSRHELNTILFNLIDKDPSSLKYHKMLSEIPQINTIITTNYDKLFELAYERDIYPIISNSHIPYANSKRVDLYKVHGDIGVPDSILISSKDYTEFFNEEQNPIWTKIKSIVAEKTILFVGFSLADQNIDYLINNVIRSLGSNQKEFFLVSPNMPPFKVNELKSKKVEYINMTGEDFITQVHSEIKKK